MNNYTKIQDAATDRAAVNALTQGTLSDPFGLLGPHKNGRKTVIRTFQPGAQRVELVERESNTVIGELLEDDTTGGLFVGSIENLPDYLLRIDWGDQIQEIEDPYSFGLLLGEMDLHLIGEGRHYQLYDTLGAHPVTVDGVAGVRFAVWAPNAKRVSVVGNFNAWDGRRHPMRHRGASGVWEIFVPRLAPGEFYKYEILGSKGVLPLKADPVAGRCEPAPGTASIVPETTSFQWQDDDWMRNRHYHQGERCPISIYEVHVLSWRRVPEEGNRPLTWTELQEQLIPYVQEKGFTHIELLPITAHPFHGSWGYQPIGLFAPMPELGRPEDFAAFVNACHQAEIGVICDWVPAHFPTDPHGLMQFDGTALYEHQDAREGYHQDWNTLIYNLGRNEVKGFLLANALHWLNNYHVDALRVDAVASMLYRDYSRKDGEWVPNKYGGRENLESIAFLQHLNGIVAERAPGALVMAEESTAWPGVTQRVDNGGLGFSHKWNMGWMHDTLNFMSKDPLYRGHHLNNITFGLHYAFSEHFVLPLSHDEVVHGKGSLIGKMPGDAWQKFANLRSYFGFMWGHPGRKLLFMGGEFGQRSEWNHNVQLDWPALSHELHSGAARLISDLNKLYRELPALHLADDDPQGFRWIIGDDKANSVFAFIRRAPDDKIAPVLVVCNFTPVPRQGYRLGVPRIGFWKERLNSDAHCYGGSNMGNGGGVEAERIASHGQAFSISLDLPPLSTSYFVIDK